MSKRKKNVQLLRDDKSYYCQTSAGCSEFYMKNKAEIQNTQLSGFNWPLIEVSGIRNLNNTMLEPKGQKLNIHKELSCLQGRSNHYFFFKFLSQHQVNIFILQIHWKQLAPQYAHANVLSARQCFQKVFSGFDR